jgi:hypothetical protein
MKSIVVLNACGVAVSASISWLLIEWTRTALLKAQQGLLPLPAFTSGVFKLQPALFVPVAIFALVAVIFVRSNEMGKGMTILVASLAMVTIIITSAVVSAACLLPWFPYVP